MRSCAMHSCSISSISLKDVLLWIFTFCKDSGCRMYFVALVKAKLKMNITGIFRTMMRNFYKVDMTENIILKIWNCGFVDISSHKHIHTIDRQKIDKRTDIWLAGLIVHIPSNERRYRRPEVECDVQIGTFRRIPYQKIVTATILIWIIRHVMEAEFGIAIIF